MAMASRDSVHQGAACGFVGGIQRQKFEVRVGTNGIMECVRFVLHNIGGNHRCAFVKESKRYSSAQSTGPTGDEGDFVGEAAGHGISSVSGILSPLRVH